MLVTDHVKIGYLCCSAIVFQPLLALRARRRFVPRPSEGYDGAKALSGNNEWHISPATQRAFRKTALLPSLSTYCPRAWLLKVRWETGERTATATSNWLVQTGPESRRRRRRRRVCGGVAWDVRRGPSEHAQWRRNAVWWQHSGLSHLLMHCALLAPGPFPSSLLSSQINLLWNEHKVSGWCTHTHIHTFLMCDAEICTAPRCTAPRCTAAGHEQISTHRNLLMHTKRRKKMVGIELNGWYIIQEKSSCFIF